ncbi:MAG TPA: ribonuclease P protein component [Candidatus Corynebacterium avicola]|uniref:Ribonuclease P protein component n=1 Tax=Candidatus Corynebacterium avicola TaxID=2838527 RepID=A0A9D1RSR6_9CORY|nr:ribonuclease P protein component [Candidatus Corynebacterium avicola]
MLPPEHRLRSTSLFGETVRRGKKKGTRTVVVYLYVQGGTFTWGPRMGLVVSKAVGNAVTRHAVSRRLRHVTGSVLQDAALDQGACLVLRALPASATATSKELEADVRRALRRLTD